MYKKFVVLAVLVCFGLLATHVYAEKGHGKAKGDKWDLEKKFSHKAGWILKSQEDLGLSDEQVKKIKALKYETQKDLIRKKAEIEIIAIDIKAKLHEDTIDTASINSLIDKKYDIKKEKAKSLVAACIALKATLTEEQKAKLKDLWKKCKLEKK